MGRLKSSFFALVVLAMAIVLSGCASSSPDPGKPLVVATVGAPTPIPTEPPEPTVGPTWTPTPTPRPPPVTLSDYTITVVINGDQPPVSGDPDHDLQFSAQNAVRQDTVKFMVRNTGEDTLNKLEILYQLAIPMTFIDSYNGQTSVAYRTMTNTSPIGVLKPGESRDIELVSPPYGAMLQANVTISAKWDGGTLELYAATLEPNFKSGSSFSPVNTRQLMSYGSAYN